MSRKSIKFPKLKESTKKGEDGITILKKLIEIELNWLFRANHKEHDFGIDAYIDVIAEDGGVTGKTIAAQVKTGKSYFSEKTELGWVYRGEMMHLNYYLNHDIPVIIVLVDDKNSKVYWTLCDAQKTEEAGENWKLIVPFNKYLHTNSKRELLQYVSPIKDYVSQLENLWKENKNLKKAGRILFNVDKNDVIIGEYKRLIDGVNRLKINLDIIMSLKGKVDIAINGYDDDVRELYEIGEVIKWIDLVFQNTTGLSYFLATDHLAHFLRLMQYIKTDYKIIDDWQINKDGKRRRGIEFNVQSAGSFLLELYADLNEFCKEFGIPKKINKEISMKLANFLMGENIPDVSNGPVQRKFE